MASSGQTVSLADCCKAVAVALEAAAELPANRESKIFKKVAEVLRGAHAQLVLLDLSLSAAKDRNLVLEDRLKAAEQRAAQAESQLAVASGARP
jgi:hypothetical protein